METPNMENIQTLLDTTVEAARIGGKILKEGFGTLFEIGTKEGKNNIVTEYDFKSEKAIKDYIHGKYPDHEILAEESGLDEKPHSDYRWIIDPLDGTVNYSHNIPVFCVSIAIEYKNEVVAGAIYHPLLEELFTVSKGGGAYLNGKRMSVSENPDLDFAILVTGFPYNIHENPNNALGTFVNMVKRGLPVRRLGSAALDLAYTAAGRFDAFWESRLKPWDVAAGVLMVTEAGGKVSRYDNETYSIYDETLLATNGKLHESASQVIVESMKSGKIDIAPIID